MNIIKTLAATLMLLALNAQADVSRAAFTSAIEAREPVDQIGQLANDKSSIFFFTEITGMSGKTITHRWQYNGETRFEISFQAGADRWRVWSNKTLSPDALGEWKVTVVDEAGNVLREESFAYVPAANTAAPAAPAQ
jgi:hypothetical protein